MFTFQAGDGENLRHIETVELHNDGSGLGFGIVGGRTTGVIVKTILPGGVADRVRILCPTGILQSSYCWKVIA